MPEVIDYNTLVATVDESSLIDGIMHVYKKAFDGKESKYKMRRWINNNIKTKKETLLICVSDNKVCGYCVIMPLSKIDKSIVYKRYAKTYNYGFISDLCSVKKGSGTMLIEHAINHKNFKDLDLILTIGKKSLLPYYKKFGFLPKDVSKKILRKAA